MKNSLILLIMISIAGYSAKLTVNFNDGTSAEVYEISEVEYIQIAENPMVFVQGGYFEMGDEYNDLNERSRPVHEVYVSDFYIGKYEVTQLEWSQHMNLYASTSYGYGDNYPAYNMNWYSVLVYCNKRSIAEDLIPCYSINSSTNPNDWGTIPVNSDSTWNSVICDWKANGYRLPTEAEWEYAARGGIHWADHYYYSGGNNIDGVAWNWDNVSDFSTRPVGMKLPNQLGIYDMSGNVEEFCWDWSDWPDWDYYQICYDNVVVYNPTGSENKGHSYRIIRGGSIYETTLCRVAFHYDGLVYFGNVDNGFRTVRKP